MSENHAVRPALFFQIEINFGNCNFFSRFQMLYHCRFTCHLLFFSTCLEKVYQKNEMYQSKFLLGFTRLFLLALIVILCHNFLYYMFW